MQQRASLRYVLTVEDLTVVQGRNETAGQCRDALESATISD